MSKTYKMILSSLLVSIGIFGSSVLYIPIGPLKAFPLQHAINVISGVLFGPVYAVINAFLISLIRNLSGTGTLLAFPGSMIGALLAGLFFYRFKTHGSAALGEWIGTGILGSFVATLMATTLLGIHKGFFLFFSAFSLSSFIGGALGWFIVKNIKPFLHTRNTNL